MINKTNAFALSIILFFVVILNSCDSRNKTYQEHASTVSGIIEIIVEPVFEEIYLADAAQTDELYEAHFEFHTLDSGTIVDTRLLEKHVSLVLKIFEAIEKGDLSTFRSLLEPHDGSDILHHLSLIQEYFENIVGVDNEKFFDAVIDGGAALDEIQNVFWNIEFPAVERETGLFVKEMTIGPPGGWEISAIVVDNNYREKIYLIRFGFEKINRLVRQNR